MGLYPAATWRLLCSGPADGATNMAVDEAIVQAVAETRGGSVTFDSGADGTTFTLVL